MMRNNIFKVSVIIPVFNEEGCIPLLLKRLTDALSDSSDYEIIFVDDGSSDKTLDLIKGHHTRDNRIQFLSFSRNFGHQNALRAGLRHASGDCIISMDADLQHPPELIPLMIRKWKEGYDIVYTIRKDGDTIPFLKRYTSKAFYRLINSISDFRYENGEADFRLLDRKAVSELNRINEDAIFYRGIIKWIGFEQTCLEYIPEDRSWGKSKYSNAKMMKLALSGLTGSSVKPLRLATLFGISIAIFSFIYGIYALYVKLFTGTSVGGWTSVFFMVSFIGGIQLIMIGILGEYIGRIFIETKKRPPYIIKEQSLNLNLNN